MISKKLYIIIITVFVVFFVVMFGMFGIDELRKEGLDLTIIMGNRSVWKYNNKKWIHLSSNSSKANLNWQKYHVYSNYEYLGEYYLWNDDEWYAFDEDRNAVTMSSDFLAFASNYELVFYPFSEEDVTDFSSVKTVLNKYNLDEDSTLSSAYHVESDFDSDGIVEDFYVISNVFVKEEVDEKFSFVYMVKENKITMIYEDISNSSSSSTCSPYFTSFLDVDRDSTFEFILSCEKYSVDGRVDMLYQFKNKEFKIAISN